MNMGYMFFNDINTKTIKDFLQKEVPELFE